MPRDLIIETDPVLDILQLGRDRVTKAWIQKRTVMPFLDTTFAYCMLGAIFEHSKADKDDMRKAERTLQTAVTLLIRRTLSEPCHSIAAFNDDWRRLHSDVVQAYDVAIELRERSFNGER